MENKKELLWVSLILMAIGLVDFILHQARVGAYAQDSIPGFPMLFALGIYIAILSTHVMLKKNE